MGAHLTDVVKATSECNIAHSTGVFDMYKLNKIYKFIVMARLT